MTLLHLSGGVAIQRVVAPSEVAGGVLLDAVSDIIDDLDGELDDVERVEHGTCVLVLRLPTVVSYPRKESRGTISTLARNAAPRLRNQVLGQVPGSGVTRAV